MTNFFALDDAVPGTKWPEAKNPALKFLGYCQQSVQQVFEHIFGNIFLSYILSNIFTLDDAVPGTEWPEAKKSALTTPKDRKTKDELDNFLNLSIGIK